MKPLASEHRLVARLAQTPILPLLVGLAARIGGWNNGFVLDDIPDIVKHPVVNGSVALSQLFSYTVMGQQLSEGANTWRPLFTAELAMEWRLWGGSPLAFQLSSIFWYLLVVLALWLLLRRLAGAKVALLGTSLFATLAVHSEAVASAAHRSESMALALGLFALLLLSRAEARWWHLVGGWLAFAAALLSKESALACGPIAFLLWFITTKRQRIGWVGHLGSALIAVGWLGWRHVLGLGLTGRVLAADNPLLSASASERWWTPFMLLGRYLRQTFTPLWLAHDHSYAAVIPSADLSDVLGLIGLALVLGLLLSLYLTRRARGGPVTLVRLGVIGFFCSYLIVANGPVLIVTIFAERLFFAPSLWLLCWLLGLALMAFAVAPSGDGRLTIKDLALTLIIGWGALQLAISLERTADWRNTLTLNRAQVSAEPRCVRGHLAYASAAARAGQNAEAIWHLALAINGRRAFPHAWSPPLSPRIHALPPRQRLAYVAEVLAPKRRPMAVLRAFRRLVQRLLGPAAARELDRLRRQMRAQRAQ